MQGPRIYNLFPLLAGPLNEWPNHLPRINKMGFNWLFINPFHMPGFSGSLYAVKDYYALHPMLLLNNNKESWESVLAKFIQAAKQSGLEVIMDLVINHTSKDAVLVSQHPEWYVRDTNGNIRSPHAIDPANTNNITVWGDLAELDYTNHGTQGSLIGYWQELVQRYLNIGFRGFRCDAAYKVPADIWKPIIDTAKQKNPEVLFFAETLGCKLEEVEQLRNAGFDYLFNSAKWWDFREPWLLEQYEMFRHIAPSISFPESHDTERLAAQTQGNVRESKLRYLFSAYFSSGTMMPMGYEFGFQKKLDVVSTRPQDWEPVRFDLVSYITEVNKMKAQTPILNEEGPQICVTTSESPITGLLRRGLSHTSGRALALINTDVHAHPFSMEALERILESGLRNISEITPERNPNVFRESTEIAMAPREMRIFYAT